MTTVTRRVRRETSARQFSRGQNRPVIVVLEPPGDRIGFRLKGERKTFSLPVGVLYAMAVRAHHEAQRDRKKLEREQRRKGAAR